MNKAFESIKRGLEEAIEHASGKNKQLKIHKPAPVNSKKIRKKIEIYQDEFMCFFDINFGTVRHTFYS